MSGRVTSVAVRGDAYRCVMRLVEVGGRLIELHIRRSPRVRRHCIHFRHGTPPELLRCELAAVGYHEVDVMSLAPADGYLAVFVPPATLPAPEAIRPCRQ